MISDTSSLIRTEEEAQLGDAIRAYTGSRLPVSDVRRARELSAGHRVQAEQWQEILELGWPTLNLPSAVGGADAGLAVLAVVAEELGRNLADLPLVSTAMAASCLAGANDAAAESVLADIVAGTTAVALAAQEGRRHDPFAIATVAERSGETFVINGTKTAVGDADIADRIVVATRTSGEAGDRGGITLVLVDAHDEGISRRDSLSVDGRWTSRVTFTGVRAEQTVGNVDDGAGLLERAFDVGTLLTAAEMVGAATVAFETTLAFLKEREQFGAPIGSFQALQHRIARVWVALELATSAVSEALRAFDGNPDTARGAVSMAKAMINDASRKVTAEGLQMHGGLGMTDEADIGLYLKRVRVAEQALGTSEFHRGRFASTLDF